MLLEIILLALILLLVPLVYKLIIEIYRTVDHGFGMWYNFKHYTFPDLDKYMENATSQYEHLHSDLRTCDYMTCFPTIDDPSMKIVYNILSNQMQGMDSLERANFLLTFVQQNFRYVKDSQSTGFSDYWRFPIQTMKLRKGDCEDMAFLLANLYYHAGLDTILVWVTGHMTVAVNVPVNGGHKFELDGKTYTQAEATSTAKVGRYNKQYDTVYCKKYPLIPTKDFMKTCYNEKGVYWHQ